MGHIYPWGKKFRDGRANLRESGYRSPTDIGRYGKGAAKFSGCYELSGNVWEWTSSRYDAYPGSKHKDKDFGKNMMVIRGGSFRESRARITSVYRGKLAPDESRNDVGFRCAK
jgi:iron(II)-dependent oxidoreductase